MVTIPILIISIIAIYINRLFPLHLGSKSRIFVPLWGKILICKLAEENIKLTITHTTEGVQVNDETKYIPANNDLYVIQLEDNRNNSNPLIVLHTQLVSLTNDKLSFTYGYVFDDAYDWLTHQLYNTNKVSWDLMLQEWSKYKKQIKNM